MSFVFFKLLCSVSYISGTSILQAFTSVHKKMHSLANEANASVRGWE